jgi:hypothetical protein
MPMLRDTCKDTGPRLEFILAKPVLDLIGERGPG